MRDAYLRVHDCRCDEKGSHAYLCKNLEEGIENRAREGLAVVLLQQDIAVWEESDDTR